MRRSLLVVVVLLALMPCISTFAQGGELLVRSPMRGETVFGDTMTVFLETPGITITPSRIKVEDVGMHPEANKAGQGHLQFMLDLQPVVVWDSKEPYTFQNIPAGDHVLTVEVVQNDHSSFDPPVLEQISFKSVDVPGSTPLAVVLPNTGLDMVSAQPSTYALIAIGSLCILGGFGMRRLRY